jgi:hypothetical protein
MFLQLFIAKPQNRIKVLQYLSVCVDYDMMAQERAGEL